jgi:cytochrome c oxidase subunit 3
MSDPGKAEIPFEHFETIEQQHQTARLGMWFFLATEVMVFGGIFVGFAVYHNLHPAVFAEASRSLAWRLEAVNTVILVSGGMTMAFTDYYAERLRRGLVLGFLATTIGLGIAFLVLKGIEYHGDYVDGKVPFIAGGYHYDGLDPQHAKLFFNSYFMLTGLHALHMLIALGLLTFLWIRVWLWEHPFAVKRMLTIVGMFWAFIDVAWLFIYTTLYLIDR